jgi:NAD(P)-dependent dehydrogenase (short-subunit alcohol dehydrogenase family)
MQTFEHKRVLVTGGSRGLGLGVVEALVARHADVSILAGDATDPALAELVLRDVRTSVLVLNAGTMPTMVPLDAHTWESFSSNWNTDVKATFHWVQAALRLPLENGSRVLLSSSGAALEGSPLSGSWRER